MSLTHRVGAIAARISTAMQKFSRKYFTGERAMFATTDAHFEECTFADGESPLKESADLLIDACLFRWKYPLWYCRNVTVRNSTLFDTARAGVWYTSGISLENCVVEAPKTFRRSQGIRLTNVALPNAAETLWNCSDVTLTNVTAQGTYFGMGCRNVTATNLVLTGDYCFDGAEDLTLVGCKLLSKDSFWNCRNVTVRDSFISGEYLCWNAQNVTFINCTIESLQGMCYVENLTLVDCKLLNTTRALEYSTVDAQIVGGVDSIVNPLGGRIVADSIGTLTLDERFVDPAKTTVSTREEK